MTESDMADEPQDPEAAADRLEAALERIARLASARPPTPSPDLPDGTVSESDIAERLDHLIERLRHALDKRSEDGTQGAATKAD